jgi:hypothetical protein
LTKKRCLVSFEDRASAVSWVDGGIDLHRQQMTRSYRPIPNINLINIITIIVNINELRIGCNRTVGVALGFDSRYHATGDRNGVSARRVAHDRNRVLQILTNNQLYIYIYYLFK